MRTETAAHLRVNILYLVLLTTILMAQPVWAETGAAQHRDAQASLDIASIKDAIRDIHNLNDTVGKPLVGEQAHQLDSVHLYLRGVATYEADVNVHNADADKQRADARKQRAEAAKQRAFATDFNAKAADYNRQCNGRQASMSAYNWCVQDRAQLVPIQEKVSDWQKKVNAWGAEVTKRESKVNAGKDTLDKQRANLNQILASLNQESNKIHTAGAAYTEKYDKLVARIKNLETNLGALQKASDMCKHALASGASLELMHETCGRMFDGNAVHDTMVTYPVPDPVFKEWAGPKKCTPSGDVCVGPWRAASHSSS